MLCVMGGALGVVLATSMVRYMLVLAPPSIVAMNEVAVDGRILVFALAITLAVSVASGLWPALRTSHIGPTAAFRDRGLLERRRSLGFGASWSRHKPVFRWCWSQVRCSSSRACSRCGASPRFLG